ncbi:S-methyl-5'-thioinosine phosphorylase [Sutterella sp.]|uniref:S-methyl-5'-thioinosine phosphorylase n=1 Tax=Sutterella sp. TaxID=1981025 RepID=UPI0025FDBCAD|nr:S-methyl-5'-thioinosine phosphorylase [uncultured Sutterella sp.]
MFALIGGTGFEESGILTDCEEVTVETPYGAPAAPLVYGKLGGTPLVFLRRHGARHEFAPHRVPYRANLWALKAAGVEGVIAVATVGGVGEAMGPGMLMVPDQILDYTWGREHTYYDSPEAGVKHVDFTYPFDAGVCDLLIKSARRVGRAVMAEGVYACTQGPRLESAAEVRRFARDGANVIGMTLCPECALARELDLPYGALCVSVNSAAGLRESRRAIRFDGLKAQVAEGVAAAVDVVREALCFSAAAKISL